MNRVDQLENENRQLRDELQAAKARLGSIESNIANNTRQADDSLRKAWETVSRLTKEADKRTSK
jgi:cell division septum initiation protein DivIVA